MTHKEIISKKRTVKLVTGLNYYSNEQTIPVLGKLPSQKIETNRTNSDWGLDLGLRNHSVKVIPIKDFDLNDYDCALVDGNLLLSGIDYNKE